MTVRRLVIGNDPSGKTVAVSDERLEEAAVNPSVPIRGTELWVTDTMPVDNDAAAVAEQEQGSLPRFHNLYVGNGRGSAFRVTDIPPDTPPVFHRTCSIDYDIVLSGVLDLHLDGERSIRVRAGDTVVLRGALHAWSNPGPTPATIAFVMIDARPVIVDGQPLGQHYPSGATPS